MKPGGVRGSGEINCIWNVSVKTLNHERGRDVLNPCRCFINPVEEASIKVAPRPKNKSSCLIPEPPSAILPAGEEEGGGASCLEISTLQRSA